MLTNSLPLGETLSLNTYKCGHIFTEEKISLDEQSLDFVSKDGSGKIARDYQKAGVEFIIKSGFNAIIGDQMRLGKTPQSLLALANAYEERTPCLILVRSANLWQWVREYKVWTDTLPNGIWPINGTKDYIPDGFSAYIISMDTFSRPSPCKCGHSYHKDKCKKSDCSCKIFRPDGDSMVDKLLSFGFKLVIADEAHSFKNTQSNRSQALVKFLHDISEEELLRQLKFSCIFCQYEWIEDITIKVNITDGVRNTKHHHQTECPRCHAKTARADEYKDLTNRRKCGVIMLTGTPIKNAAHEYFVPLNIVCPERFNSFEGFQREWLSPDGKRVIPYKLESFKRAIAPYVLRREKEDVFTDLPPLNRIFTVIQPDKDALVRSYNTILDGLESKLAARINPSYWDMKDELMELRRICGLMKVPWTADYLETCLMDSDKERYAVGIHHKDVRDILKHKLGGFENCLSLSGEDSAENKDRIMRQFEYSKQRVLVINMLAGGVGMDFHYVNNILILERQWSSADEEQFEFRFYNPDIKINNASTTCEYIVIKGSIEQFFYEMVEEKRKIFGETVGTNFDITKNNKSFKELVEMTVGSRL